MFQKRLLVPDRVRRPPREGFSWIDNRFLREFSPRLTGDAILLYFFFVAVSDKHGLSYYSDGSIAVRLRMSEQTVTSARDELVTFDLIAYQVPLVQVLALPKSRTQRADYHGLRELFRSLDDDQRST